MAKHAPKIPQNLVDRVITYFAPRTGVRRLQARGVLALSGGYSGAKIDRQALAGWRTTAGSPASDILPDLPKLRERSRDLVRNSPIASGAINTSVVHVVGTGLSCKPTIDAEFLGLSEDEAESWQSDTSRRYRGWSESVDCHSSGHLDIYGIQDLAFRSMLESGDALVLLPEAKIAGRRQLTVQIVEADRVCNPKGMVDSETLSEGVERDPVSGRTVAFQVCKQHPGDIRIKSPEWTRVEARGATTGRINAILLFEMLRPDQTRGVPWLAPIIEPLKQLTRYSEAELAAAVTSGLYSIFVKMDPKAFDELYTDEGDHKRLIDDAKKWSGEIEAGQAVNLLPGESIETSNPSRPNEQFDPFFQAVVRQIGMALGIPFEVLIMHYQSSYTAARGALLMAWRFWKKRRSFLASYLCRPIYETWLAGEVADGRIRASGFFANPEIRTAWSRAIWTGDGPGSVDPEKEVRAAKERVALEISTLEEESLLHDGVDWQTKHRQRVREISAQVKDGTRPDPAAQPEPGAKPPKPADK